MCRRQVQSGICDFSALHYSYLGCHSYSAPQLRPEAAAVHLRSLAAANSEKEYEIRKSRRKGPLGLCGVLQGSIKGP